MMTKKMFLLGFILGAITCGFGTWLFFTFGDSSGRHRPRIERAARPERPTVPRIDRNLKNADGFFQRSPETKFKFLSESKVNLQNLSEIQAPQERVEKFHFHLTVLDPSKKEISKKPFRLSRRETPRNIGVILQYLEISEKAEVHAGSRELRDIAQLFPESLKLTENHVFILQRLK